MRTRTHLFLLLLLSAKLALASNSAEVTALVDAPSPLPEHFSREVDESDGELNLTLGRWQFNDLTVKNSIYPFHYSGMSPTYNVSVGASWVLLRRLGAWALSGGLAYTRIDTVIESSPPFNDQSSLSLHIIPISLGAEYRFDYAYRQRFIPFVGAGMTYFAYFQTGNSPDAMASGGTWYPYWNAGLMVEIFKAIRILGCFQNTVGAVNSVDFRSSLIRAGLAVDL